MAMRPGPTMLDEVSDDLARWIDDTATAIALAFTPQGVAPFSAQLTQQQKLEYYRAQLFNADGSPNPQGRLAQVQKLGALGFAQVYKAVIQAYPDLKVPAPPQGVGSGAPPPLVTPPPPLRIPPPRVPTPTTAQRALVGQLTPIAS